MSLRIAFRHAYPGRAFDIAIEAPTPGTTVLFGASGAGKSTIAKVAAGLLRPAQGLVAVDGDVLSDSATQRFLPPERRRVGFVSQDAHLFPHLSVAGNLRYGLRRAHEHRIGWEEVIGVLGIGALLDRDPRTLSGGERQRVAIGRALLSQPRLLIMDEPLASLDTARRVDILPYIASLAAGLALPVLYVTHAQDEVARLADTLVLIENGRVAACGPVGAVTARANAGTAAELDAGTVLACVVLGHLPHRALTRLGLRDADGSELLVPLQTVAVGGAVRVRVPAAEVILAREAPRGISVQNAVRAEVAGLVTHAGAVVSVELRLGGAALLARITQDAALRLALRPGISVLALVKSVSIQVLT